MTVDIFTREQFERVLDNISAKYLGIIRCRGLVEGEYTYDIVLDAKAAVRIRSSIGESGVSDPVGQDSIRLWLVHYITDTQISKIQGSYVTRVPGWSERLDAYVYYLSEVRKYSGDCTHCQHPLYVYRSKTDGINKGRLFASCFQCRKTFFWLEDEPHGTMLHPAAYFEPKEISSELKSMADQVGANTGVAPDKVVHDIQCVSDASTGAGSETGGVPLPPDEPVLPGPEAGEGVQSPKQDDWSSSSPVDGPAPEEAPEPSGSPEGLPGDIFDALAEEENAQLAEAGTGDTPQQAFREPNEEQSKAIYVSLDGSYRVLAPPGSGKTFLLIRRIRFLLESGVNMANILAVTFNKTMADELYRRLVQLMPEIETSEGVTPWFKRNISTIHAACYRMLMDYGDKRRYPEKEQWKIKAFLQDRTEHYWPEPEARPSWREVLDWIYTAKFDGVEDFERFFKMHMFEYHVGMTCIREEFDKFMKDNNWLMFGDMLYSVELLLRHDPVFTRRFQTLYKYILVDEGQDTSGQAMRILTTLAEPQDNFFIVGDTDQLLYRFAGATPEANLYEGFEERFPNGSLIKLVINYRSTSTIIDTCNRMIRENYSDKGGPYDQKYLKDVQPRKDAPKGALVSFYMVDTPQDEAWEVAREIEALLNDGYKPQDVFIGSRTRAQLAYLEPYLLEKNIPFINIAGVSFWDSRHIADLLAFLTVAVDSYDEQAFSRIYNIASNGFVHPWGDLKGEYCSHHYLPRAFLAEVKNYRNCANAVHSYRFPYKYSWKPGMEDIVETMDELQAVIQNEGAAEGLRWLADNVYLKFLLKELGLENEADGGPIDDINTLIDFSTDFDTVRSLLDFAEKAREQAKKAQEKAWDDSVVISTIHRLKGLERKVVIGIGIVEGKRIRAFGDEPAGLLPHTFSLVPPPNLGVLPGQAKGRIEDERCIAFVLVSRAMERVVLFGCNKYQDATFGPSRFIREMGVEI